MDLTEREIDQNRGDTGDHARPVIRLTLGTYQVPSPLSLPLNELWEGVEQLLKTKICVEIWTLNGIFKR